MAFLFAHRRYVDWRTQNYSSRRFIISEYSSSINAIYCSSCGRQGYRAPELQLRCSSLVRRHKFMEKVLVSGSKDSYKLFLSKAHKQMKKKSFEKYKTKFTWNWACIFPIHVGYFKLGFSYIENLILFLIWDT